MIGWGLTHMQAWNADTPASDPCTGCGGRGWTNVLLQRICEHCGGTGEMVHKLADADE